ncbi:ABC transporter ATP-binding protein [Actinoallomurus bryophytorum]|uniref:Sulfonate transport system ATP-binding protein n=1 Tax=Actinoallomurus bryophytorum TaxID=1490222 RepID=A0A543CNQ6_9ACTN|nr:ABC transporter ATP-binding protein [Actinoallomurus bryophytorum]TQL98729.1 sulfonate transport system ATP-binding protein [Actinoallomurus bryophytorum]
MATSLPTRVTAPVAGVATTVASTRGLSRAFDGRSILDGLDLDIERGEFVALLGRSGSGKSTLLRALAGLDRGTTGDLTVRGTVSVAFQEPRLLPWKRVIDNIALGLDGRASKDKARAALEEVGLTPLAGAWPLTLSGGEAQRASLARALVREPGLLLLDEPFSALDALTRITMHRLVLDLWTRHADDGGRLSVLLVTHDVDEALLLADRVLVLGEGRIAYESRVEAERPRRPADLIALRGELLRQLGVEEGNS